MRGPFATRKDIVIMGDREKGLDIASSGNAPYCNSFLTAHSILPANIQQSKLIITLLVISNKL